MKILIVSSFLPYPLYSGGHIRLYNLIKELSTTHEITLVCEKRAYQTIKDIEALEKFCKKVITINRKKQWSVENVFKTIFSQNAFLITGHTLGEMEACITSLLKDEIYDLIHCETSYVFQNIPQTTIPVVMVEHNIEYSIYEKFAGQKGKMFGSLLSIDVLKLKRIEESYWKKAAVVVAVSENEEKVIKNFAKKTALVPNGVDLTSFHAKKYEFKTIKKNILFIGDFNYIQNQDAARYLLSEIYPRIKEKDEANSISLWIVGRKIPDTIKQLTKDSSVSFDENATQPTAEIFSSAAILLAPLRVGGGTQYKILESFAVGTPVVTTTLGKEGLSVRENKDILIADSSSELAEKAYSLLHDEQRYNDLSQNGRKLVEKNYSWTEIAHKLEEVYASVVK
jgi:glycosyltransferase involved in cell wall biosynthesis